MASCRFISKEKSFSLNPRLRSVGYSCRHLTRLSSVNPRVRPGQSLGPSTVLTLTLKVRKRSIKTQLQSLNRERPSSGANFLPASPCPEEDFGVACGAGG